MNVHGYNRGTNDLDYLVHFRTDADRLAVFDEAERRKWEVKFHQPDREDPIGNVTVFLTPLKIDLIEPKYIYQLGFLSRALQQPFQGVRMRIVSPEDLIILKLLANGPQDKPDAWRVLESNPNVD